MESSENINTLLDEITQDLFSEKQSESSQPTSTSKSTTVPSNSFLTFRSTRKISPETLDEDSSSQSTKDYNFLNASGSKKIEEDIKTMRSELKKSQQFFISARDSLESINFENIRNRIKDLNLQPSDLEVEEVTNNFNEEKEDTLKINLSELTKIMGSKFQKHPGEFADIPDMSTFFKVCTQLQHGLDDLNKKRISFNDLGQRIVWATNVSETRSKDIQKMLSVQNQTTEKNEK